MNSNLEPPPEAKTSGPKRGCLYWLRLAGFGIVSFVVLGYFGYISVWVMVNTAPAPSTPCCQTPADFGFDHEDVTFTSEDNTTLRGWYIPSTNGAAVIFLHGYGANRAAMWTRAQTLAEAGYGVLLYDQRAHGQSDGDLRVYSWIDVPDAGAALDFVLARPDVDPARVGMLGFSNGGMIALRAAAEYPQIAAVVAEEPGFVSVRDIPPRTNFEERAITLLYWLSFRGIELRTGVREPSPIIEVVDDIAPRPVLFMSAGESDNMTHRLVEYQYDHTGEPSELWQVPEAYHGQIPRRRPEEYPARILDFFNVALLD